mgnify:CR=1 FL=1
MDSQIITVLFSDVIKSSEILDDDHEFADKLKGMLEKLPKPEVGKYGQIKEWAVDYDEVEIGHRHISQLFALHPADFDPRQYLKPARQAIKELVTHKIVDVLGCDGKAF